MNTDITYCTSTSCRHFAKCRRALDDATIDRAHYEYRFSVSRLLRADGTCEVEECE